MLELEAVDMELEDCHAHFRRINQRLFAQAVWRAGEQGSITRPHCWPNPEPLDTAREWRHRLIVSDSATS